jgi:nitroimidazol reductase NimA-like FMN-containing flavoprotein (pyridoxamine 5'-phosphate oxidase superfamily)
MALHWDPKVAMSKEELDHFLNGRLIARLSTIDGEGFPTVTPVWYLWDGKAIFFNLGRNRAPTRNLTRNPKCGAVIDVDHRPLSGQRENFARGVTMTGVAEVHDRASFDSALPAWRDGLDFSEMLQRVGRRYSLPPIEESERVARMIKEASPTYHPLLRGETERVLVRMEPTKIRAWDFSKAPFKD